MRGSDIDFLLFIIYRFKTLVILYFDLFGHQKKFMCYMLPVLLIIRNSTFKRAQLHFLTIKLT